VKKCVRSSKAAALLPISYHLWVHPNEFQDRKADVEAILARYPDDVQRAGLWLPSIYSAPADAPSYRWMNIDEPHFDPSAGLDARIAISDWSQLDDLLADFPKASYPGLTREAPAPDGRYRVAGWWFWLFERHWSLRGMSNALMDFYTNPREVHRLYEALTDFYIGVVERAAKELQVDGVMTSDDIGTQTGPFFSPEIFRQFFKPYYRRLIDKTHELGMHFWLHSCGCIEPFLDDLIEIGLDVIHPIQKYTMDERKIARRYGGRICIWGGFDVQQTIPWGSVEDVRREVRFMIDTYHRPDGRFLMTAGNGVNGDCPVESLEALFQESLEYGKKVCQP